MNKTEEALASLYAEMRTFAESLGGGEADRLVFGEGACMKPPVLLLGEAPGAREVEAGRPFVGTAGKNLDEFLSLCALERQNIYVSNAVKFRPVQAGKNGDKNRTPTERQIAAWMPFLQREIALLQPGIIVTLGNIPLRAVMGKGYLVGDTHGRMLSGPAGEQVFSLYHPAAIIYRRELKQTYIQDILRLKALLWGENVARDGVAESTKGR